MARPSTTNGFVMPLLNWAIPSRYYSIHKNNLACAMVAQSEQAFLALVQGGEDSRVQGDGPFFVAGDSDAP